MLKNLRNRLSDNKGFSLVELIVVIAIMVILIAILVPNITGYINKSRDVSAAATAKTIYDAAYAYQTELLGKNDMGYKDNTVIEAALKGTTGNGIYKVDIADVANNLSSDDGSAFDSNGNLTATDPGENKYKLFVDKANGGKISVAYHSFSEANHVAGYPVAASSSSSSSSGSGS